jgi:hypothetical protein
MPALQSFFRMQGGQYCRMPMQQSKPADDQERVFIESKYLDCLCGAMFAGIAFEYKLHKNNIV